MMATEPSGIGTRTEEPVILPVKAGNTSFRAELAPEEVMTILVAAPRPRRSFLW